MRKAKALFLTSTFTLFLYVTGFFPRILYADLTQPGLTPSSSLMEQLQTLDGEIGSIQNELISNGLNLRSLAHPEACPILDSSLSTLAEQMAAVSESLHEDACYQKHFKTIDAIQKLNQKQAELREFDESALENGAFAEYNPDTYISITNNQTQTLNNTNSLIGGLFKVSQDKDCVESLKKTGNLKAFAEVLTRLGAIGMFFPSSVGMVGGAVVLATGGGLLLLNKLIQPDFHWNIPQERRDFLTLNCAFYQLHNQLEAYDFFVRLPKHSKQNLESGSDELSPLGELQKKAAQLAERIDHLAESVQTEQRAFQKLARERLVQRLRAEQLDPAQTRSLHLLLDSLELLRSNVSAGATPGDRYFISLYFSKHLNELERISAALVLPSDLRDKLLTPIRAMARYEPKDLMQFTRKSWQNVQITSLRTYVQEILLAFLKNQDPAFPEAELNKPDFSSANPFSAKMEQVLRLKKELAIKRGNLERAEQEQTNQHSNEGSAANFDIRKEYKEIRNVLLGKKGWKFLVFLVQEAKRGLKQFDRYTRSHEAEHSFWNCANAKQAAESWDLANASVQLAKRYLETNEELLAKPNGLGTQSRILRGLRYFPVGPNFELKMGWLAESARLSHRASLAGPQEGEFQTHSIKSNSASWGINLGLLDLRLQQTESTREALGEVIRGCEKQKTRLFDVGLALESEP